MRLKRGWEKIIHIGLNVLLVIFSIILLITIYVGLQTKILGNDFPNFFGYSMFEVQTNSMKDYISAGDLIIVELTGDVELNDVITFRQGNDFITHRVIEAYKGTFITKGDANNSKDEAIKEDLIVGKVVKVLPNFGIIQKTLFNPVVVIALIITLWVIGVLFKKDNGDGKMLEKVKDLIQKFVSLKEIGISKKHNDEISDHKEAKSFFSDKDDFFVKKDDDEIGLTRATSEERTSFNKYKTDEEDFPIKKEESIATKVSGSELDSELVNTIVFENGVSTKEKVESNVKSKEQIEEDLSKTSMFRVISVEMDDTDKMLDEVVSEVEEKEELEKEKALEKKRRIEEKEVLRLEKDVEEEKEDLVDITLKNLEKKIKRSKNLVEKVSSLNAEKLNELIKVITGGKLLTNEASIKNDFITCYLDCKYYNYYSDSNSALFGTNVSGKLDKVIREYGVYLATNYKGTDTKYKDKVAKFTSIFLLINILDKSFDEITDTKLRVDLYKEKLVRFYKDEVITHGDIKDMAKEFNDIFKKYKKVIKRLLELMNTKMFNLEINKISREFNGVVLQHHLDFNKVYSDYIIDKTYNDGIIAEDKVSVLFNLLMIKFVEDIYSKKFNNKYLVNIPSSLFGKEKKIEKMFSSISTEFIKNRVIILLSVEDVIKYKVLLKKLRKENYTFAIMLDKTCKVNARDKNNMYIADYIFANKEHDDIKELLSYLPNDLLKTVSYVDLSGKVGDIGSE